MTTVRAVLAVLAVVSAVPTFASDISSDRHFQVTTDATRRAPATTATTTVTTAGAQAAAAPKAETPRPCSCHSPRS